MRDASEADASSRTSTAPQRIKGSSFTTKAFLMPPHPLPPPSGNESPESKVSEGIHKNSLNKWVDVLCSPLDLLATLPQ
jgi:hypothetical protein